MNTVADNAKQFVAGMTTDPKVYLGVIKQLAQGNGEDVNNYIHSLGYSFSAQELSTAVQDADSGDIRVWGGAYAIALPDSLKGETIAISSQNGAVRFAGDQVGSTVKAETKSWFSWKWDGKIVKIMFTPTLTDAGVVKPTTFKGTITDPADQSAETISGKQIVAKTPWYQDESSSIAMWILGVIGFVSTVLGINALSVAQLTQKKDKQLKEGTEQLKAGIEKLKEWIVESEAASFGKGENKIDWSQYQEDLEQNIRDSVTKALAGKVWSNEGFDVDVVYTSIQEKINISLEAYLESKFEELAGEQIDKQLQKYDPLSELIDLQDIKDATAARIISPIDEDLKVGSIEDYAKGTIWELRGHKLQEKKDQVQSDEAEKAKDEGEVAKQIQSEEEEEQLLKRKIRDQAPNKVVSDEAELKQAEEVVSQQEKRMEDDAQQSRDDNQKSATDSDGEINADKNAQSEEHAGENAIQEVFDGK
jgi:hypothetical protein